MFVANSMTPKVVTIAPNAGLLDARGLMIQYKIRHLPVVEGGKLIGMITDRDIRSALPSSKLIGKLDEEAAGRVGRLKVRDAMSTQLTTITPFYTIQDALLLIQQRKVGALPVVDKTGALVGIVSVRDLLRAFINVLGIEEPGTLIGLVVEDHVGQMKRIVDAITEEQVSFGSILVAKYWEEGKKAVFPYLLTLDVSRVKRKLKEKGFTLLDPMQWYLDRLPKHDG